MPIVQVSTDHLRQLCTVCQQRRDVPFDSLSFTGEPDGPDTGILAIPPCGCGATEFLVRAPQDEPEHPLPGSYGHLHRLMVDALVDALQLRDADSAMDVLAVVNENLGVDAVEKWFPNGLQAEPLAASNDAGTGNTPTPKEDEE